MRIISVASSTLLIFLVVLNPTLVQSRRLKQARFFENCASTEFRISEDTRYVGGAVMKSVRLASGEGVLDCMDLCSSNVDCWSFNYNKNRKGCWLMSTGDSDARTQSNTGFDSGYRECAPSDADLTWSNDPIDFGAPADTQG